MEITEVRVKHVDSPDDRLRAFCTITFDDSFVVRDLKIIDGADGLFVAMPNRRVCLNCQRCGAKNSTQAYYCNECGSQLRSGNDPKVEQRHYVDVAHPINKSCRDMIQTRVIEQFHIERSATE